MFKKVLSVILSAVMLLSLIPVSANATEPTNTQKPDFDIIRAEYKNNTVEHYDEDGNEVDITSYNREAISTYSRFPESFNLKEEYRVTPIKDQGMLGLCWDFASTACIESSILSTPELVDNIDGFAHEELDLSEAGNTWYIHKNIEDENSVLYGDFIEDPDKGTRGGYSDYVAYGFSSGYGAYPEKLMPYDNWHNGYNESLRYYSDYRLKDYNQMNYDIELIKQSLMEDGAVGIGFNCFMSNYNMVDGIEAYYDNGKAIDSNMGGDFHDVVIIGWDDNFSKEYFYEEMRPENDGAWLIKNSWGTESGCIYEGFEGCFWMSYESNIGDVFQFKAQSADNFDNIYQNSVASSYALMDLKLAANVFTAQSNEELEQICFANIGCADFTVEIYKLNDNYQSPTDGELLTSFTDSVDFSGIHCIECPQGVYLSKGDIFSVVLTDENSGLNISYSTNDIAVQKNISFVVDSDDVLADVADVELGGHVNIKAYTSNKDGYVNKSKLEDSIKRAEEVENAEGIPEYYFNVLESNIFVAKTLLTNQYASQKTINNFTCILNSSIEDIEEYYYEIDDLDDFMYFYDKLNSEGYFEAQNIILNTDLDLSSIEDFKPLYTNSEFTGIFDGNDHTISGLKTMLEKQTQVYSIALATQQ